MRSRGVTQGRFLTQADEDSAAAVVVLGPDTAEELFGDAGAAVGRTVVDDGTTLQVVGVLRELSSSDDRSNNDLAIVPLSTYQQRLVGEARRRAPERLEHLDLHRAVRHVVLAADDVRDPQVDVVDHARQQVEPAPVLASHDGIAE